MRNVKMSGVFVDNVRVCEVFGCRRLRREEASSNISSIDQNPRGAGVRSSKTTGSFRRSGGVGKYGENDKSISLFTP